jgi:phosphate starvation-inducible PhoH-like protein
MRKLAVPEEVLIDIFGHHDENLRTIERGLDVSVSARGTEVAVQGQPDREALATNLLGQLIGVVRSGYPLKKGDVEVALQLLRDNRSAQLQDFFGKGRLRATNGRYVTPKSLNQKQYLDAIRDNDLVFVIGPAGTGKTFLAVAAALAHLSEKRVERIILCRPAVEAGEKIGFLPGDMAEKVDPYFRPLYDALYHLHDRDRVNAHLERGTIEIAPLAFMRGRTLNNSFVILDEAQNTTSEQMMMFLTRLGMNSKAVVTGDVTQVDLPSGRTSGLIEARTVVASVAGIRFIYFNETDVVRHPLVQSIIKAYEAFHNGHAGGTATKKKGARPAAVRSGRRGGARSSRAQKDFDSDGKRS